MKTILPSLFLIMFFTSSTQAQSCYCGFENDDDPFCGYKNDGWDRYNNYSELAAAGTSFIGKWLTGTPATLTIKLKSNETMELSFYYRISTDDPNYISDLVGFFQLKKTNSENE
ncbi:uncharacterized protein LOC143458757 [Clavelina lepadiformis]|uniref:uncharacterized protein LOC143458757 n=1 Tax=Clavelina lepadiformis TaxID=159417 RepID=UPI0040418D2F